MSDISDITLRIRVDILNSAAMLTLVNNMNKVDAANRRMKGSVDATARGTTIWSKAFDKVVGHLERVERKFDAVFRAAIHMQSMGRDLIGFARKVGGAAASLVQQWGDFQFTLNRAAAAADIFDTQSAIYEQLRQSVNEAAHELRVFPAEEVAKGLYFWQSTTGQVIKTQEDLRGTMKSVTAVMKVAAMTDTSFEQAIKGVYATLKQFNLGLEETANVSALLFYATQKTALEFPDLINSLKMTGAVAGQAKEPLATMVAVLGAIGNAGIRGSQAGRALRQTYIKIVRPSKQAKEVLDDLFKAQGGYNKVAFTAKGNFIGVEKYVTKLAKSMKGLTYQQRAYIISTITTANELPVMTQMINAAMRAGKNWIDTFADQQAALEAFNGSWGNLENSWRGVMGGITTSFMPVLQEVGKAIADVLTPSLNTLSVVLWDNVPAFQSLGKEIVESFRPVVERISAVVNEIVEWAAANPKLIKTIAKWGAIATVFAAVAGAVLLAAGTFVFLLSNIVLIVAGMTPMLALFGGIIAVVVIMARKVAQNVGNIQQVFVDFIKAVQRFFTLFFFGSEGATKGLTDLADTVDTLATGAMTVIAKVLKKVTDALNNLTPEQVQTIKNAVKAFLLLSAGRKALGFTADSIRGVSKAFRNLKRDALVAKKAVVGTFTAIRGAASGFVAVGTAIVSGGASLVGFLKGGLLSAIGLVASAFSRLFLAMTPVGWVILAIGTAIAAAVAAYETNFMGFRDFVDGLVVWFNENVVPVLQAAVEFLAPIIAGVVDAIVGFINTVIEVAGGLIQFFLELPGRIWEFITSLVDNIVKGLQEFVAHWDYYLGYAVGVIVPFPVRVLREMVAFGVNLIKTVVTFLVDLVKNFAKWFGDILKFLGDWFGTAISNVIKWAGELIGGIVDFFVKLPGRILDALVNAATTIATWFADTIPVVAAAAGDLIKGIVDFFIALPGNILNAIVNLPQLLTNAIRAMADVGGKVIKAVIGVGEAIIRGLWDGITGMVGWFTDKITGFFGGLIEGVKDTLGIQSPSKVFAGIGANIIEGLGRGIERADAAKKAMSYALSDLTSQAVDGISGVGMSASASLNNNFSTEAVRRIELSVDVTSADGSVSQVDMNTLAGLITGSDMVRALERMSTVD